MARDCAATPVLSEYIKKFMLCCSLSGGAVKGNPASELACCTSLKNHYLEKVGLLRLMLL